MRHSDLTAAAAIRGQLRSGDARRAREAARVTAAELAAVTGVSRQSVSAWETGAAAASMKHALAYGWIMALLAERAA
jgi:DNA-binding XRE family transcriptional regulator